MYHPKVVCGGPFLITFQDILTDRLRIRCLQLDDAESMFSYRSDTEVARFQSWEPQSLKEVRAFIEGNSKQEFNSPGWYQVGIALRDDRLIGDCGIHVLQSDQRVVEIGITIAPAAQSKGHASEALNALLNLLFMQVGKHRVFASVDPRNLPSMALMNRLGMRQEAHFVQSLWFKDAWADDVVFAMLASEWREKSLVKRGRR
jgi:RimJ/RimL family protein N-acetyltransferase